MPLSFSLRPNHLARRPNHHLHQSQSPRATHSTPTSPSPTPTTSAVDAYLFDAVHHQQAHRHHQPDPPRAHRPTLTAPAQKPRRPTRRPQNRSTQHPRHPPRAHPQPWRHPLPRRRRTPNQPALAPSPSPATPSTPPQPNNQTFDLLTPNHLTQPSPNSKSLWQHQHPQQKASPPSSGAPTPAPPTPSPASPASSSTATTSAPTNDGPVGKIENGDGALVAKVYLDDGFTATFTGVYDTALTYPAVGDTCIVTIPKTPSNGGAAAAGAAGVAYNCTVDSMLVPKGQRKKEAMVTVKVSYNSGVVA
jgi:hypothetical protein